MNTHRERENISQFMILILTIGSLTSLTEDSFNMEEFSIKIQLQRYKSLFVRDGRQRNYLSIRCPDIAGCFHVRKSRNDYFPTLYRHALVSRPRRGTETLTSKSPSSR